MKENKTTEFKENITNSFLKTVSAYANYDGGDILFGVDDSGSTVGIEDTKQKCLDIENKINDSIEPRPEYDLQIEKNIIRLKVYPGYYKPYLYNAKAYKRNNTSTVPVDNVELKRLILEGSNTYFEQQEYTHSSKLTFDILEEHLKEQLKIKKLSDDILKTLDLYTSNNKCNNAAALVADTNTFNGIDIVRFGDNIDTIMDRNQMSNISILKEFDDAIDFYKRYYQYEEVSGKERIDKELVPETAYREAIANALVHRTWDVDEYIKVAMYQDRIEIVSPGGLPARLTKEEYLSGNISIIRNPIISNIFFRLHYIEMFGTGIRRIREAYKDHEEDADFEISDNHIKVILPVIGRKLDITNDEKKILNILKSDGKLSSGEIIQRLEYSKAKTLRILKELSSKKYIKVSGNGRGTKYSI